MDRPAEPGAIEDDLFGEWIDYAALEAKNTDLNKLIDLLKADKDTFEAEIEQLLAYKKMITSLSRGKSRDAFLDATALMEEHPKDYDGPCLCQLCSSYGL